MEGPVDYVIAFITLLAFFFAGALVHLHITTSQCEKFGMTSLSGDVYVCHLKIDGP